MVSNFWLTLIVKKMAVTFPESIHPKNGYLLRFDYEIRAFQYLDYFKITSFYPEIKFFPLDISFETREELRDFLSYRGIVRQELEWNSLKEKSSEIITIIDSMKIYEVKESVSKFLLLYKFYSINEVAEMLSFSRPSIYKLIKNNQLDAIRLNGQLRISHSNLMGFINKGRCE
jgi:excisionase family DNA binding protein